MRTPDEFANMVEKEADYWANHEDTLSGYDVIIREEYEYKLEEYVDTLMSDMSANVDKDKVSSTIKELIEDYGYEVELSGYFKDKRAFAISVYGDYEMQHEVGHIEELKGKSPSEIKEYLEQSGLCYNYTEGGKTFETYHSVGDTIQWLVPQEIYDELLKCTIDTAVN